MLAKESIILGTIEIKCPYCNTFNTTTIDKLDKSTSLGNNNNKTIHKSS